ncbi:MAG: hypothetical protein LW835_07730 [Burkholderiaceae bacterium]|nr:hypothetical protein [Burkholderiaceae bacterium]
MLQVTFNSIKPEFQSHAGAAALITMVRCCLYRGDEPSPYRTLMRSLYDGEKFPVDLALVVRRVPGHRFVEMLLALMFYRDVCASRNIELSSVFCDPTLLARALDIDR